MNDPYQRQLDELTQTVVSLGDRVVTLSDQAEWLLARVELLNALLGPLVANAGPAIKGVAIAAAQVKGERLQEQGPATIAEKYARLLAGIASK